MMKKILYIIIFLSTFLSCQSEEDGIIKDISLVEISDEFKYDPIAYQFETYKLDITSAIKYDGSVSDLDVVWKMWPTDAEMDEETNKYDSAVVLSRDLVLDVIIPFVPGDYRLSVEIKEPNYETISYELFDLQVQTKYSNGICVFYENGGLCDIAVAKIPFIDSLSEAIITPAIYSSVNDLNITSGRCLGTHKKSLYLFTESGGVVLNADTYEIKQDDYKELFALPFAITPNPMGYDLSPRPIEFIINGEEVHGYDHASMGVSTFGDRLSGDYSCAPKMAIQVPASGLAAVIYDSKNHRLAPINQFGTAIGEFAENPGGVFDLNSVGVGMKFLTMMPGFNSYTYAFFKDQNDFVLYIADFSASDKRDAVGRYSWNFTETIGDVEQFLVAKTGAYFYCSVGSKLYRVFYQSGKTELVWSSTGGDIVQLKLFTNPNYNTSDKLIGVATSNGAQSSISVLQINPLDGKIIGKDQTVEVEGEIKDFIFKY